MQAYSRRLAAHMSPTYCVVSRTHVGLNTAETGAITRAGDLQWQALTTKEK